MNQKHYKLLKQGVVAWNAWRKQHPDIRPDLSEADLGKANLSSANLVSADLVSANLSSANLSRANLGKANLWLADLSYANLSSANLGSANLRSANLGNTDLSRVDLSRANLSRANLNNACLRSANLSEAHLWSTIFARNNLSTVKGLTEINHSGPSHIELHTVKLPQDGSALHFLRGAGIPDELIDWYRASIMKPIQYASCFISYSSSDELLARRLHADLQDQGVRCWFAPEDMKIGDRIRPKINEMIHVQDKLLLILSESSVQSKWVAYEVETALTREIQQQRDILFPVRIDDAVFQSQTNWAGKLQKERHIGDFTRWAEPEYYQMVFQRLLRDLQA